MSTYLKLNGKYVGVAPNTTKVYADRPAGRGWEEVSITKHEDGMYDVLFVVANLQLSILPNGTLETRPAGTYGPWEQLSMSPDAMYRGGVSQTTLQLEGYEAPTTPPSTGIGTESGPLDTYDRGGARLEYGFKDASGKPWFLAAYTTHLLPCVIAKGEDHTAIFKEALGYGANALIPICTHLSQWKKDNGYLFDPLADEPQFQRVMEIMCNTARDMKMRLAPAILADVQGLDATKQQRIIDLATEVFANYDIVLPRMGNECNVNGYDPDPNAPAARRLNMNKVHHLLWSLGSYGENNPPLHTGARWAEWEGRRDYTNGYHKAMDDAGAGILELNRGYSGAQGQIGPFHCPVVGIEMPYFADTNPDHVGDHRWTDPAAALQLGLNLGANAAGMGVGTSLGLECKPNGALAADCAREQFRGAKAAFLRR